MADFSEIIQEINTNLPDNNTQLITAAKLRTTLIDLTNEIDTQQDAFEESVNEAIANVDPSFATLQQINDVSIINDLTTGGENNVASADTVKILNDNLTNLKRSAIIGESKNIFNKNLGGYVTGFVSTSGTLTTGGDTAQNSITSPIFPIKPNTVYAFQIFGETPHSNYLRLLKADKTTVVHGLNPDGTPSTLTVISLTSNGNLFKTDSEVAYAQFTVKYSDYSDIRNYVQIVESDELQTEYYPYDLDLKYEDLPEQLMNELSDMQDDIDSKPEYTIEASKNLINLDDIQPDKRILFTLSGIDGLITNTTGGCVCSAFIPIEAGETYYLTRGVSVSSTNAAFAFASGTTSTSLLTPLDPTTGETLTSNQFVGKSRAYKAPSNASYAIVCMAYSGWDGNVESLSGFQLEKGSEATPYEPFYEREVIPMEHLPIVIANFPGEIENIQSQIDDIVGEITSERDNIFHYNSSVGESSYIRSKFDSSNDIRINITVKRADENYGVSECLTWGTTSTINSSETLTSVHSANDDISPLYSRAFGYYGANHGYDRFRLCTVTGHGKDATDIGAVYTKDGVEYTIMDIYDENTLVLLGENNLEYPLFSHSAASTGDYVYVSGGTHIAGFTVESTSNEYSGKPIECLDTTIVTVDGKEVTESGDYMFGDKVVISQNYKLVNMQSVVNVLRSNAGSNTLHPKYAYLSGVEYFAKLTVSYIFPDAAHIFIAGNMTYLQNGSLGYYGFTQQGLISGNNIKLYIPKSKSYNGSADYRTNANYSSLSDAIKLDSNYWEDGINPPDRYIENSSLVTFSSGYLFDYGVGGTNRKNYTDGAMQLAATRKIYLRAFDGGELGETQTAGANYSAVTFRIYKPVSEFNQGGKLLINKFEYDNKLYIYADFNAVGTYEIDIPTDYIGKTVEVYENSSNVNLLTSISSNNILVDVATNDPMYGYLVAKIQK